MNEKSRIIVALDGLSLSQAGSLLSAIEEESYQDEMANIAAFKVHNLVDRYGQAAIKELSTCSLAWPFVDYKLYDIPNTVGLRAEELFANGATIITVHASGGIEMMEAAKAAAKRRMKKDGRTRGVWAITVLTSLDEGDITRPVDKEVVRLALMAKKAGVDGIVCSAKEVGMLSKHPVLTGLDFVVPGIRLSGTSDDDQKRIGTPRQAMLDGATYLVVGRPITQPSPELGSLGAIKWINQEVTDALAKKSAAG